MVALTTVNREPGQDLIVAAISGVTLCEGRLHRASHALASGGDCRPNARRENFEQSANEQGQDHA